VPTPEPQFTAQDIEKYLKRRRFKEPFHDISDQLPGFKFDVILDVGANIGQSCVPYATYFPNATIHAFEPVPSTFEALKEAVQALPNIHAWNCALGAQAGHATMRTSNSRRSRGDRIVEGMADGADAVKVPVSTGASFCAEHQIEHVSFLKIDTEGYDLNVLKGFEDTLAKVDFVQVEAGMNPHNKKHVPFRDLEDFLLEKNFLLFRFYGQTFEFAGGGTPAMRRANPVFINLSLVDVQRLR
jgi:FkbM family methyltransferase